MLILKFSKFANLCTEQIFRYGILIWNDLKWNLFASKKPCTIIVRISLWLITNVYFMLNEYILSGGRSTFFFYIFLPVLALITPVERLLSYLISNGGQFLYYTAYARSCDMQAGELLRPLIRAGITRHFCQTLIIRLQIMIKGNSWSNLRSFVQKKLLGFRLIISLFH